MPTYGSPGRRVAIVAGLRTPFARSGTTLKSLSAIELGKRVVAELIQRSEIDGKLVEAIVYGGAESLSNVPILHSRGMSDALVAASRAKSFGGRVRALGKVRPRDLVPITPAIAEPSTGESMGESAEKMAKINHISREEQDAFALRSHRLAAAGTQDGRLTAEIAPLYVPPTFEAMTQDDGIRADTS